MRSTRVVLSAAGPREKRVPDHPDAPPEPGPGEARVRVLVISVAFTDVMIRKGMYPDVSEKPPFVADYDLVGIVAALVPGVTGLAAGDRVAELTKIGAYAEYICLPADSVDGAGGYRIPGVWDSQLHVVSSPDDPDRTFPLCRVNGIGAHLLEEFKRRAHRPACRGRGCCRRLGHGAHRDGPVADRREQRPGRGSTRRFGPVAGQRRSLQCRNPTRTGK